MEWSPDIQSAAATRAGNDGPVRTVGVEEELLVVGPDGRPVPLGPDALTVASRRGEGEDAQEHDRSEREDEEPGASFAAHLMPELKAQQIELGTPVCRTLAEVEAGLRFWRGRAQANAAADAALARRYRPGCATGAAARRQPRRPSPRTSPGSPPHRSPSSRAPPRGSATRACWTRSGSRPTRCSPAAATCTSRWPTTTRESPSSTAYASGCPCAPTTKQTSISVRSTTSATPGTGPLP